MIKQRSRQRKSAPAGGITIGVLAGLSQQGVPLVDYAGNANGFRPARATLPLSDKQVGLEVALMFEDGDRARPVILGVLQKPGRQPRQLHASVDGETITLAADKELVLKCGKAVVMLTEDGKVTIRGTYLLSRSSGVNRIQGGSIQLN